MATIVNARDVLLQAYSPRVNSVSISDNTTIDLDQVNGLDIVNTKGISLVASSQIIQQYAVGGDTPASITLTVIPKNLTNSASLTIISGTVSGTHTFTGYSVTIPTSDISSDVVVFRAGITQDSVTYYDYITVVRSVESDSDVVAYTTNEYIRVPADELGNVLTYSGVTGNFKLWQGTYDISTSYTFSILSNPDNLTASIGSTTGAYSITGNLAAANDDSTIVFRAVSGASTIDRYVTIVKNTGGESGFRTARSFSIPLNGISSFSDSLATLVASTDNGPVLLDVVTQYNTDGSFTQSKYYTGSAWASIDGLVDGNLLVTGSVGANALSVNELSAITAEVGNLTIGTGGSITSSDYVANTSGVKITGGSSSTIEINTGNIGGTVIDSTGIESDGFVAGTTTYPAVSGSGWRLDNATGKITSTNALFLGRRTDGSDTYSTNFDLEQQEISIYKYSPTLGKVSRLEYQDGNLACTNLVVDNEVRLNYTGTESSISSSLLLLPKAFANSPNLVIYPPGVTDVSTFSGYPSGFADGVDRCSCIVQVTLDTDSATDLDGYLYLEFDGTTVATCPAICWTSGANTHVGLSFTMIADASLYAGAPSTIKVRAKATARSFKILDVTGVIFPVVI